MKQSALKLKTRRISYQQTKKRKDLRTKLKKMSQRRKTKTWKEKNLRLVWKAKSPVVTKRLMLFV